MKKILTLVLVLALALTSVALLAACDTKTYEIALITDVGNIDDKSFNEGAWNGVKEYAEENNISYQYFRPLEDSQLAREKTIKSAILKGAKVVVCPGFLFESSVYQLQKQYPEVNFLLLDVDAREVDKEGNLTGKTKITENVHCIIYQEEQAGFLAGYAAVKDGYRKLGFIGGMAVPAVQRFGHGYVDGAEFAAKELNLLDGAIELKYWYSNSFAPSPDTLTKSQAWYDGGTEVIFACGGGLYLSVIEAAAKANKKVIGVDTDQYLGTKKNETFISSAMKELKISVKLALKSLYANSGKWDASHAAKVAILGAQDNCVGLPLGESWRFAKFTIDEYNELYKKLQKGEIVVNPIIEVVEKIEKFTPTVKVVLTVI
ncbi:MAG: BMP family ABC transporter substrate-binding protein [Clostridia bacterium]